MKAFVERICDHVLIIRAGPEASVYGDSYDGACVAVLNGKTATIKALAATDSKLTLAHVRAGSKLLNDMGYEVVWERVK